MEKLNSKQNRWLTAGFFAGVFLFMFFFFFNIHPLVIFDADDWTYVSYSRIALPSTRFFNPARILPEILMSGCSNVAVFAIMPLVHDYIRALSLMYALVLAGVITVYTWCFLRLTERKLHLERGWTLMAAVLFLIFHFLIFRTENGNNSYMFHSCNVTCYFYYTIPALLNCSLLMYFLSEKGADAYISEGSMLKKGILILLCYLAVFSNLFESIIIATYAGCEVLFGLICTVREKRKVWQLVKEKAVSLSIFVLWCVSSVFELMGERAADFGGRSFGSGLEKAVRNAVNVGKSVSWIFLLIAAGLAAMALLAYLLSRKNCGISRETGRVFFVLILSGIIVAGLILILGAKTSPSYIEPYRADLIYGMLFFPLLLVTLCGAYVMKNFSWTKALIPLVIVVLLTAVNTSEMTFAESNTIFTSHEKVAEMSRDVMQQVIEADKAGLRKAEIKVCDAGTEDNWPQATYMGPRIANSLQKHGLVSNIMELTIVPSQEFNEKYGLDFEG